MNAFTCFKGLAVAVAVLASAEGAWADQVWVREGPVFINKEKEQMPTGISVSESSMSYTDDYGVWQPKGASNSITWTPPPARLKAGDVVTLTMSASTNQGALVLGEFGFNCGETPFLAYDYCAASWEGGKSASTGPAFNQGKVSFKFKPSDDPTIFVKTYRWDPTPDMYCRIVWKYKLVEGDPSGPTGPGDPPPEDCHLAARLDNDTVEVVRGQNSQVVNIWISGWKHNTDDTVDVIFPAQKDAHGTHPNNVVVPLGPGSINPAQMGGVRGPDGSYGVEYPSEVHVRARSNSAIGTTEIPIVVRQKGCGEVELTLFVRVLEGRPGQVGPSRGGDGKGTGDDGGPVGPPTSPPITQAASPTGFTARLSADRVVVCPGRNSETVNLELSGWRGNTSDAVEIRFPQEGEDRGNLGNDIVVFPANTSLDPANMTAPLHTLGFGFRAMEKAPNGTTAVTIIVRQRRESGVGEAVRFDQLKLVLWVIVPPADACAAPGGPDTGTGTGLPPSPPRPPNNPNGPNGPTGPSNPGPGTPGSGTPGPDDGTRPTASIYGVDQETFERGDALIGEATAAEEEGNYEKAIVAYKKALQVVPKHPAWWEWLGNAYGVLGRWSDGEPCFRESVRLEPTEPASHVSLGWCLLKLGQREAAKASALEALRLAKAQDSVEVIYDHELFPALSIPKP